ncbi:low molecular weight protein-tyrosine-phosphatase [uncultured Amnibacterium sp.]|uniref:low molecular weight protein-tyrosine-phosphatase n=1 Tax=uncultured Amnibacterium sp. TaxID=1631851 RepID=UPI0035CA1799
MTVCTGNICRSPIAEAVLRDRFESAGLGDSVQVDSTGVSGEESGNPIDPRAAAVLRGAGYPVPAHRARQVRRSEIGERDLILAMTARHAQVLRALASDDRAASRIRMYRSFDPAAQAAGGSADQAEARLDVRDPWYGDEKDFEATLAQVEAAADAIVDHVRAELNAPAG